MKYKIISKLLVIGILLLVVISIFFFISRSDKNTSLQDPGLSLTSSDDSKKPPLSEKNVGELITLYMTVNLVQDSSSKFTTNRTFQDVERILREVNTIWSQADIVIKVDNIVRTEINALDVTTIDDLSQLLRIDDSYDPQRINAYFVQALGGANGIAYTQKNMIFLADYTTVNDFRAISHEIGHILGLSHTDESQARLLYRGVNGTQLVKLEIQQARRNAGIMEQYE